MATLFAVGGGIIQAEDEAVAAALGKAAEEPVGLQSLGLIHASEDTLFDLGDKCVTGAYGRVGPEDVSTSPIEYIARCAEALQPEQFADAGERARSVSATLNDAADQLNSELTSVLGSSWQGEFAISAQDSVRGLVASAHALAGELEKVAAKAERAHEGWDVTRTNVREHAASAQLARGQANARGPGLDSAVAAEAQLDAAEEQARAIVNTVYSPAVMDSNLDDMDFTTAYRVVSTTAIGGPGGVDIARVWNTDGIVRPAPAAAPTAGALTAAGLVADPTPSAAPGGGAGHATAAGSMPATDAATEQALLATRSGAADLPIGAGAGAGAGAGVGAGTGTPGAGLNASTQAAGAPFAPAPAATTGQQAGLVGSRGIRGAERGQGRHGGFGTAAGAVGSGGAAAAGAGAMRMGGAGTLAGIGSHGLGGPAVGAPGAPGAGGPGAAPGGAGSGAPTGSALSSSSSGAGQAGRPGGMPMGGMMGAGGAGNNSDRRGHTPAGYLTNATNTTEIIGDPVKVTPAVLGRAPAPEPAGQPSAADRGGTFRGTVIGREHTGVGAERT